MYNKIVNGICGYFFFLVFLFFILLFLYVVDELKNEFVKNYFYCDEILDYLDIKGVNVSYCVLGIYKC